MPTPPPPTPPPTPSTIKTEHRPPVRVKRHRQRKLRHRLVAVHGTHFARRKALRASRVVTAAPARSLAVLAVNVDQRPVLLPSSRFRHNALFLSSISCSLIAVELHCDAWRSHEVHSTLQPLCGSVRVRWCRIFVIALPWVRSKFEQLQGRPGTA